MEIITVQEAKKKGINYLIFNWLPKDDNLPMCVKWVDNINRDPLRKACLVGKKAANFELINVAVDKQPFEKERSYGERKHRFTYHPRKSR